MSVERAPGAQNLPRAFFVTGTDTGVGKTLVASALCFAFANEGFRVAGMKPVASGCKARPEGLRNDDALALIAAMNVRAAYADVNPYAFAPAIAPHIAAAESGIAIEFDTLDRAFERLRLQSQIMIVEGAGGWLAPLDGGRTFADLVAHWQLDVILVVGLRLGCLNHALLTAEAVERRGLRLSGWAGNRIDPEFARAEENIETLRRRLRAPCIGIVPYQPDRGTAALSTSALLQPPYFQQPVPSAGVRLP
jgi:dethiobiotin synthetase